MDGAATVIEQQQKRRMVFQKQTCFPADGYQKEDQPLPRDRSKESGLWRTTREDALDHEGSAAI